MWKECVLVVIRDMLIVVLLVRMEDSQRGYQKVIIINMNSYMSAL